MSSNYAGIDPLPFPEFPPNLQRWFLGHILAGIARDVYAGARETGAKAREVTIAICDPQDPAGHDLLVRLGISPASVVEASAVLRRVVVMPPVFPVAVHRSSLHQEFAALPEGYFDPRIHKTIATHWPGQMHVVVVAFGGLSLLGIPVQRPT